MEEICDYNNGRPDRLCVCSSSVLHSNRPFHTHAQRLVWPFPYYSTATRSYTAGSSTRPSLLGEIVPKPAGNGTTLEGELLEPGRTNAGFAGRARGERHGSLSGGPASGRAE